MELYKIIARAIPDLKLRLLQARMLDTPEYYARKTVFSSLFLSIALAMIIFMFTESAVTLLLMPILFTISFFYFLRYVDTRIEKIRKEINREIVFAGRFLIIEIESGVPLYQAFQNLSKNYEVIGTYFQEIVERIDLGTSMEDALNETITLTPSPELRKMLWQLLNSIKTGSEISKALIAVFDQIVREQQIEIKEYGRKLNPLAMFYMMIAIIVPSLGTIMLIVATSFLGLNLNLIAYFVIAAMVGFMQFMFLAVIRDSRPALDI